MICRFLLFVLFVITAGTCNVNADEIRPAYLQLTEIEPDVFQVLWKVPARGETQRLSVDVQFDERVKILQEPVDGFISGAHLQRWIITRSDGLDGATVTVNGMDSAAMEVLLRVQYLDGGALIHRITSEAPSYQVTPRAGIYQVVTTYLLLGIEHILIGVDHLLFVLVLLMLVPNTRKLIWTITAFTVAHSITLSLAALDLIRVPVPPVEACIALSIVFVACEIIRRQNGYASLSAQKPWLVAFTFGLLHGLGFAAALGEIGLPQTDVPAALLFFNVGVEIGQLLFVAVVLALGWLLRRIPLQLPMWMRIVPAYGIGSMAAFWVFERVAGFWA